MLEFSTKPYSKILTTNDPKKAKEWLKSGQVVTLNVKGIYYTPRTVSLISSGGKKVRVNIESTKGVEKVIDLLLRGYSSPPVVRNSYVKSSKRVTFRSVLQKIAAAVQATNAVKAEYFRTVVPYKYRKMWAVDFPTKHNKLHSTIEQFRKEGKPDKVMTLYHGTSYENMGSIVKRGLLTSNWGMLGTGIYVGHFEKAMVYSDFVILEVKVAIGRCKELECVDKIDSKTDFDSMHAPKGPLPGVFRGSLYNEEWVIRDPHQVEIDKLVWYDRQK